MKRVAALVCALVLALVLVAPSSRAAEPGDRVPPSQDNGGEGRPDSLNEGHVPPYKACSKPGRTPGGSRLVRPLPAGPTADAATPERTRPPSWRYRSISESFSVWGFAFDVERDVEEMLDISVRDARMTLTGSGVVTVRTPWDATVTVDLGDGGCETVSLPSR